MRQIGDLPLYVVVLTVALAGSVLLTPPLARLATRLGVVDRPSASKYHTADVPYLGGIAVAMASFVAVGVGVIASQGSELLLATLLGALGLAIVGLIDDRRGVGPGWKLLVEVGAGLGLWAVGLRAELLGVPAMDLVLTVVWVVTVVNAVNMVDNMDGLGAGLGTISALTFFTIAAADGERTVAILALALAGACLGFLRYNFPPARVFLGDAGSLLVGFILASLALHLGLLGGTSFVENAIPVLALGVPIFDALLVVASRIQTQRPIYLGGTDHSSHRLAALGISNRAIALIAYGIQLAFSGVAIWLGSASGSTAIGVVIAISILALVAAIVLLRLSPRRRSVIARPLGSQEPGLR